MPKKLLDKDEFQVVSKKVYYLSSTKKPEIF